MLASMLAYIIEKNKITLGRMSKDFGKNKTMYKIVPTTSRRMLGKNRCVRKDKGMPRSMLRDVEFLKKNNCLIFFKQK